MKQRCNGPEIQCSCGFLEVLVIGGKHLRSICPSVYAQWPARSDALIAAGVSKGGSAETTHQPRLPLAAPAIVAAMEAAPSLRQITLRRRRDGMSYPLLPPGTLVKPQVRGLNFHWLRVVKGPYARHRR
jgi:hypothetical protein